MRGPNIKWMAQLISSYHWDKSPCEGQAGRAVRRQSSRAKWPAGKMWRGSGMQTQLDGEGGRQAQPQGRSADWRKCEVRWPAKSHPLPSSPAPRGLRYKDHSPHGLLSSPPEKWIYHVLSQPDIHVLTTRSQIILDIHTPSTYRGPQIRRWETGRLVHFSRRGFLLADFPDN